MTPTGGGSSERVTQLEQDMERMLKMLRAVADREGNLPKSALDLVHENGILGTRAIDCVNALRHYGFVLRAGCCWGVNLRGEVTRQQAVTWFYRRGISG